MEELKLVALDKDDVEVISAHVQDALVKVARYFLAAGRASLRDGAQPLRLDECGRGRRLQGRLTGLSALPDGACGSNASSPARCRGLDQTNKDAPLNLLAVEFAEHDAPAGTVTLTFSGGGAIRLEVECLEAELVDLGEVFSAATCPDHFAKAKTVAQ